MLQRTASVTRAVIMVAAAILLCGCTLSAALRHDEIRSVWGPGVALPPPTVYFVTDRSPSGTGFSQSWGGVARCGRAHVPIANAILTTEDRPQAQARQTDKGRDAARVAVEMALLLEQLHD